MDKGLMLLVTLMLAISSVHANKDEFDRYIIDDFETISGWKTIQGGSISSSDLIIKESDRSLKWTAEIIKVRNTVSGIEKTGLALPLPEKVTLWVYADVPFLFISLSDTQGNRVLQSPVYGLEKRQWNEVELSPREMPIVGKGGNPLEDLDGIFIGAQDGAGEFAVTGKYDFYINGLTAHYPKSESPDQEPIPSQGRIDEMLAIVKEKLKTIDNLLSKANSDGIDTSYPLVTRTVIAQFIDFAAAEAREGKKMRAFNQASFLLEASDRTINELNEALADTSKQVRMPQVDMRNLKLRDGVFYSGRRPVQMVGLCGWWDPSYFPTVADTGFNCISMEIGPSGSLNEDGSINEEAIARVRTIMDNAKEHNIAVDLLLSPHYFPQWAHEKYPDADMDGLRRKRGSFMPWDVGSPGFRSIIAKHLEAVIPRVRDHEALISYDLINEAWYELMTDFDLPNFEKWAKNHKDDGDHFWTLMDKYNKHRVVEFLAWYRDEVHKHDRTKPTWAKVIGNWEVIGIDREAFGDVLDANGLDSFPGYPDKTGRYALDIWVQSIMHDTYRSFQPNKAVLDGEYHIVPYGEIVPAEYITTCLWNAHLRGRDFSALWVWGRSIENEIHSFYTQPWAVEAAGKTALDLQRLAEYVVEFPRVKSEVALFYGGADFQRAYEALNFLDAQFDLISERRIEQGNLNNYKLLVIPSDAKLSESSRDLIEGYKRRSGNVYHCPTRFDERQLNREINGLYEELNIRRPVRADVWGVELRSAIANGVRCAYLMNYGKESAQIRLNVDGRITGAKDLISGRDTGLKFTLDPMEVVLLEFK